MTCRRRTDTIIMRKKSALTKMTRGKNEIENNYSDLFVYAKRLFGPRGVDSSRRPLFGFLSLSRLHTRGGFLRARKTSSSRQNVCGTNEITNKLAN